MSDKVYLTPRYYVFASDEESGVGTGMKPSLSSDEDSGSISFRAEKGFSSSSTSASFEENLIDQVTLTNHLLVGIILFIGVFFGAFCMGHLYNRIRRD